MIAVPIRLAYRRSFVTDDVSRGTPAAAADLHRPRGRRRHQHVALAEISSVTIEFPWEPTRPARVPMTFPPGTCASAD